MSVTVGTLAELVRGELIGDPQVGIEGAQAIEKAGPSDITFAEDERNLRRLVCSQAVAVIIPPALQDALPTGIGCSAVLLCETPQTAFLQILQFLRPRRERSVIGVSPRAVVSETAKIGENTNIHPLAVVGHDVAIGNNCEIHPGVSIGDGCRLGDDVVLYPNVVLYPDTVLGDRVIVHASAVIGADGFGYRFEGGQYEKLPHLGSVQIEDDVEVGAGATIDRGMIGATIIGEGTKIDNQVMIAHNCEIGKHNAFASQVGFAGSITTGDYVRCAGQVGIADHVHLGDGCLLGPKSGVHKDVPAGARYQGYPAAPEAEQLKTVMAVRKVPEMRKQIRSLESQIEQLRGQLEQLTQQPRPQADAA